MSLLNSRNSTGKMKMQAFNNERHPVAKCFQQITAILVMALVVPHLFAQSDSSRIIGSLDSDIPKPSPIIEPDRNDIGALSEILNHLKTVGTAPLQIFHATGSTVFPESQSGAEPTSLDIQAGNRVRRDVTTPDGVRSTRINGRFGANQQPSGEVEFLPADTSLAGLLAFARLRIDSFPCNHCSIADRGLISISGEKLHRIALQVPLDASVSDAVHRYLVTDFYFDPVSHLLTKSAEVIHLSSAPQQDFVRVTSYDNYQSVSGTLIPFKITESLNGQQQWQLELVSAQVNVTGTQVSFNF